MDTLSAVLAPVRLQQTAWMSTVARPSWGISFKPGKRCVRFHYVVRGTALLSVDKTDDQRVTLAAGDLAVLALGNGHALRDSARSVATRFEDLANCTTHPSPGVAHIELGPKPHASKTDANRETAFITGAFVLDDPLATPIIATLPPLIRMTPESESAVPSFVENLRFITNEVETSAPGSEIVLLRMADVMLIQILRAHLARTPSNRDGFLGALQDPSTAAALSAMHRQSEAPWTVASLAEEVGLSRSVFAARFTQLVGEPPLGYLTRLRMQKATTLLREGATLAKTSRLTGYASEASFSHAFRQWSGVAPGTWRRRLSVSTPQ